MAPVERTVSPGAAMPPGYAFLEKGNPYMTLHVRRRTHAADQPLFVVEKLGKKKTTLGLRAPKNIIDEVRQDEVATRSKRMAAVDKRDGTIKDTFEVALRKDFPNMPEVFIPQVMAQTLEKRKHRVGRTSTLSMDAKVRLAVFAHIRHQHTNYDALLRAQPGRSKVDRQKAREQVQAKVVEIQRNWAGSRGKQTSPKAKAKTREGPPTFSLPVRTRDDKLGKTTSKEAVAKKQAHQAKHRNKQHPQGSQAKKRDPAVPFDSSQTKMGRRNKLLKASLQPRASVRLSGAQETLEMLDIFEDDEDEGDGLEDDEEDDEEDDDDYEDDEDDEDELEELTEEEWRKGLR